MEPEALPDLESKVLRDTTGPWLLLLMDLPEQNPTGAYP